MYVKAIEIEGFKSFAEKTTIPLNRRLNIIIGPNGSGKSNIIDAISFVLGESSRHLRADKGVNLIYKGVKNVSKAEVSLVIDLEEDFPRELLDYLDKELIKDNILVLKRIIKKSGESSYFINNQKVNKAFFKDILNILKLNTPYNIIFQGDINNIVKSSPIEKRKIFEDLVNISYFEEKKEKVKKELEDVQMKLNELIAILKEKEKNYISLKKEKEEAERFLELKKFLNSLLKRKYSLEIREIDDEINEINNSLIKIKSEISRIQLEKKEKESFLLKIEKEIEIINENIKKEGGKEIQELEKNREELIKNLERIKTLLENKEKEINELREEISKKEERKHFLVKEIINLDNEIKKQKKELSNYETTLKEEEFDLESLNNLEREIENLKNEIVELKNKEIILKEKLSSIDYLDTKNIENELKELQKKESSLAFQMNELKKIIEEKEKNLLELKSKYEEQLNEINQDKLISKILELKNEIEGVYGPLFMLGSVDERYRIALEMAAGPRLRAIVVENEDVAKKIIDILKKEKLGVANFIPLNRIKEKEIQVPDFPGVVDRADRLVKYDKKFEKAFKYVFGDTLVIENFEVAKRIGIGRFRMVTLSGEIFETSGVITGGYLRRKQSFIDTSLEEKIKNLELEIESFYQRLEELKKERELLAEKIFELRLKKKEEEKKKEVLSNLENLKKEYEEIRKKIKEKEKELIEKESILKEKKEKFANYLSNIKEKEKIMKKLMEKKEKLASLNEKKKFLSEELSSLEKELAELYKKESELFKEIKDLENSEKEKKEGLNLVNNRINQLSEKLRELFRKKEELLNKTNNLNKELFKFEEKLQNLEKEVYQLELKKQILIEKREKLLKEKNKIEEEEYSSHDKKEIEKKIKEVEEELSKIKNVNIKAIEKFQELEKEYLALKEKTEKVKEERDKILKVISEIEEAKKREFLKAFETINNNFKRIYKELLEKGEAWLELANSENPFEGGIEIKVKITNKTFDLKSLSGGEQSLVALSLIFAIQEYKPGTFYVFDEVDAALDKRNSRKLARYLRKYSEKTQFIIISHNEEVIIEADYLFGVSMNKRTGISKLVSLDVSENRFKKINLASISH